METKTENYPSKVDAWLVAVMILILMGVLISVLITSLKTGDYRAVWFVLGCEVFTTGMILLISCPLKYQLSPEKIVVRSGVMRTEVPVFKVTKIQKTRNLLSAPAWSLDRLRIDYDNDGYPAYIIISPKKPDRFIAQLEEFSGLEA